MVAEAAPSEGEGAPRRRDGVRRRRRGRAKRAPPAPVDDSAVRASAEIEEKMGIKGDRLARLMEALEVMRGRADNVRLVRVMSGEDPPPSAKKQGDFYYVVDLQPRPEPRGRHGGRDGPRCGGRDRRRRWWRRWRRPSWRRSGRRQRFSAPAVADSKWDPAAAATGTVAAGAAVRTVRSAGPGGWSRVRPMLPSARSSRQPRARPLPPRGLGRGPGGGGPGGGGPGGGRGPWPWRIWSRPRRRTWRWRPRRWSRAVALADLVAAPVAALAVAVPAVARAVALADLVAAPVADLAAAPAAVAVLVVASGRGPGRGRDQAAAGRGWRWRRWRRWSWRWPKARWRPWIRRRWWRRSPSRRAQTRREGLARSRAGRGRRDPERCAAGIRGETAEIAIVPTPNRPSPRTSSPAL